MPCYDSREADTRKHDHLAAGLLCEVLKAEQADTPRTPELDAKLAEWFKVHRANEAG